MDQCDIAGWKPPSFPMAYAALKRRSSPAAAGGSTARAKSGSLASLGLTVVALESDGKAVNVKGDGQECPSHTLSETAGESCQ